MRKTGSIVLLTLLSTCLHARTSVAELVPTYEDLLVVLSEGKSPQVRDEISEIILKAQKSMIDQYSKQNFISNSVARYFKFKSPIAVHHISDKHFAVSFNAETTNHNYKNKVIWVLFFNRASPGEISYAKNFFSWEKPVEIEQYINSPDNVFCKQLKAVYGIDCNTQTAEGTGPEYTLTLNQNAVTHSFFQNVMNKKANINHRHKGSDITAGKIKAEFIDEAICRDSELSKAIAALKNGKNQKNAALTISASTSERIHLLEFQIKENKALKDEVNALKKTVQQLTRLLAGVTRKNDEITFSGVNIHLVNGNQTTDAAPNGLGNLIVGYNEAASAQTSNARNGSHNIIIGKNHSYTSFGGLVVGQSNSITKPCAVVSGGINNTASGSFSTVSGGQLNTASGDYSTVSGGLTRKAEKNNNWAGGNQYSPK